MPPHGRILDAFYRRLTAGITRSPLLRVRVSRTGRLLDCSRLRVVEQDLPERLLTAVVNGERATAVSLRLRAAAPARATVPPAGPAPGEEPANEEEQRLKEHHALYDLLDRRIHRHAELAKRETGVHVLWLGYPLFHAVASGAGTPSLLAPVFLWPLTLTLDLRVEGRFRIGYNEEIGEPLFNRALASWVLRHLQVKLPDLTEEELAALDWDLLHDHIRNLANQFNPPLDLEPPGSLCAVPALDSARLRSGTGIVSAAVLGYFRWPNETVLADLEELRDKAELQGAITGFVSAVAAPAAPAVPPPAEDDRYFVSEMDFSQEQAVWQARAEPGLVVHGPPGTGKSQTIVNIIADALAHERTVLMVCQKQAATRVVMERLRKAGLADLCLEVHDPEGDRLRVFRTIRQQVDDLGDGSKRGKETERRRLAKQIARVEAQLDEHARALHEPHATFGIAYRHMQEFEAQAFAQFPALRPVPALKEVLATLTAAQVDELERTLAVAGARFQQAGPLRNPWSDRRPGVTLTAALRIDLAADVQEIREVDARHLAQVRQTGAGATLPGDLDEFAKAAPNVVRMLRPLTAEAPPVQARLVSIWLRVLQSEGLLADYRSRCEKAIALVREVEAAPLDRAWHHACAEMPDRQLALLQVHARCVLANRGSWWRFVSPAFHEARRVIGRLDPLAVGAGLWSEAESLDTYVHARQLRGKLAEFNRELVPGFRLQDDSEQVQLDFPQLALEALRQAADLLDPDRPRSWRAPLLDACLAHPESLAQRLDDVERALQRVPAARAVLAALHTLQTHLAPEALEEPTDRVARGESVAEWLDRLTSGLDTLPALVAWEAEYRRGDAAYRKVIECLVRYERNRAKGERLPAPPPDLTADDYGRWWTALVRYNAAVAWEQECRAQAPVLEEVTAEKHAQLVAELRDLLQKKRELEAAVILKRWQNRQAISTKAEWRRWFQIRAGKRHGPGKRLREAIDLSLDGGLLQLRPCWLVNPVTASQLFPLVAGLFDLVIFDEASQCPLEQAVPVIYRGKALVVSGDEKQLPPTSFFAATVEDDEKPDDEQTAETDDAVAVRQRLSRAAGEEFLLQAEDLLQAAVGYLPERYLRVHYRSLHPDLIRFSNHAFYTGSLEAPTPVRDTIDGQRPIVFHEVAGTYQERTNPQEARKVVELLREIWQREGTVPTVGVVTFNQPQRELIEDLVEEECQRDEAFAGRYSQEVSRKEHEQDVGFFVKNLENVQGDERDVMIFSTTFGRDKEGRFFRRFGPLSAAGGERRLNVAVTRARRQVLIVSSMPIHEIAAALQTDEGQQETWTPAGYLQLYLAYARAVSAGDERTARGILQRLSRSPAPSHGALAESLLADDVRRVLVERGQRVDGPIGEAGFRIDLAVRHPERGYVLGIVLDGSPYHADRSARARDVWREDVLRQCGWQLYPIWSSAWWSNREQEIARLDRRLRESVV